MDYLLDTHVLIWAATDGTRLSRRAASVIANKQNTLCISAASAWEIATKVRLGKLPEALDLERDFEQILQQAGYQLLSVGIDVALRAGRLQTSHKDPFDRMIASQSLALDITLISADPMLDLFGVRRLW